MQAQFCDNHGLGFLGVYLSQSGFRFEVSSKSNRKIENKRANIMKLNQLKLLLGALFVAVTLSGCYVAPYGPGCVWVPGHYGPYGGWHPGHCA